jgi:hypothetical protein
MKASRKGAVAALAITTAAILLAGSNPGTIADTMARVFPHEIRQSAQKGLAILEVTNKDWIQTGYCYSCHHDTLLIRTSVVARESNARTAGGRRPRRAKAIHTRPDRRWLRSTNPARSPQPTRPISEACAI